MTLTNNPPPSMVYWLGIDKVSVSLNANNKQTHDYVCRPKFQNTFPEVLSFILRTKQKIDTEITKATTPEVDVSKVREIDADVCIKFRIREYKPCFW